MEKVTIIIPVYNVKDYIADCLHSVMSQTSMYAIECILVDDCGLDNSIEIADNLIESYDGPIHFKILRQSYNQGPSAARNLGIKEAEGDYVFFLDSDDTLSSDCIELLYSLAQKYDADYVQGSYADDNHSCELPSFLSNKAEIKKLLLNHNKVQFTPHNRLVRRQMLIDNSLFFNEEIKVREDFLWMTFVAKYVERLAYCSTPTYKRVYNEYSLTNNINKEREIKGYRVLIETMVRNYDLFLLGHQKELALEALIMALNAGYYHDASERQYLIDIVKSKNNFVENVLLALYLGTENSKVLHMLIRLYKTKDGL